MLSWTQHIIDLYNSHSANQFILTGNIHDLFSVPGSHDLLTLPELITQLIVPRFDVLLSYDIGNGLRAERGAGIFSKWTEKPEAASKQPRTAIELITFYLRYTANLAKLGQNRVKTSVILKDAQLFAADRTFDADANAISFLIREWSREPLLANHDIVTFILAENVSDLHPLLRQNSHSPHIAVPLPASSQIESALIRAQSSHPKALGDIAGEIPYVARQLSGATLHSMLNLLKLKEHKAQPIRHSDLAQTKAALIEKECPGLIDILSPKLTLDSLHGQEPLKKHLRQNLALWKKGRLDLIPMGYLICGPVGTGKTFLVRCLAGEAGVPVILLKNFREKWYGTTESNLEKIFRTIKAVGECCVFIDEADQSLGRRESSGSEPAVSGRVYSMLAQEMSNPENRGRILWILATSRPDLVEIDLKRPGRIDLKIPLFPTTSLEQGFDLLRALAGQQQIELPESAFSELRDLIPDLLTPGEVEALMTDLKREIVIEGGSPLPLLKKRLANYLKPVAMEKILDQIDLAIAECSKAEFIPERFRPGLTSK